MKKLVIYNSPFNDSKLKYNENTGRYELTLEYVKANFDVKFIDDGVTQKRITKNSRKIYNYIFAHSYTANKQVVEFMLMRTQQGRDFIFDVLNEQMEADVETAYNDLSSQPAVNVTTGQVIDRNELYRNQISVDAEQIIDRSSGYFGFNLLFMSAFPPALFRFVFENNK